ncbi:MAG: Transcriptional regulatory protein ZraR [Alphaproteobacteria bacterium MarineAlpha6_Bin4]|nr:MAG: Transcriptional regulatory protein ZraR [Alphaproteobacteria bacterium MarineAlpha6_Bin4]|tara:strand:- start:3796 stop:5169 length:1374 start_codon:yes stop_codon:yes gene_type:complete
MKQNILIVDDDKDICSTLSKILSSKGYLSNIANNSDAAINEIKNTPIDLVLLDVWLEGSQKDGIELLKIIKKFNPNIPVILISGHANIDMAVKAIKLGAFYFIEKPFKSEKLFLIMDRALENAFLKNKYETYKENRENEEFIGNTTIVSNLKKKIKQVSATNARVLISGDSGTGKNLIAKMIHDQSNRSSKPFITINCALLDNKNFDKTFFGNFDSTKKDLGFIQKAGQGTIYLKEICDLDHFIQGKITNFLQKETYTLDLDDGQKNNFNTNIRFISSTNRNINDEIENKRLRKDLLYRLNVASIQVPSIKKRREDIPLIINNFLSKKNDDSFKKIKLSDEVYALLQTAEWPGNVTQIRNFVDWLYIFFKSSNKKIDVISANMIPNDILKEDNIDNSEEKNKSMMNLPIKDARKNFEKQYLISQVNRFGGNISKTANFIGMERSALHRKIKEIGIKK